MNPLPCKSELRVILQIDKGDDADNTIELAGKLGIGRHQAWSHLKQLQLKGYADYISGSSEEPFVWALTEMGEAMKTFLLDWGIS